MKRTSLPLRRREFIAVVGGAAAWPLAARTRQAEQVRRVGVLMGSAKHDPLGQRRIEAFVKRLGQLGWIEGRSMQIDDRWGDNDADRIRRSALELVTLAPDDRIGIRPAAMTGVDTKCCCHWRMSAALIWRDVKRFQTIH